MFLNYKWTVKKTTKLNIPSDSLYILIRKSVNSYMYGSTKVNLGYVFTNGVLRRF